MTRLQLRMEKTAPRNGVAANIMNVVSDSRQRVLLRHVRESLSESLQPAYCQILHRASGLGEFCTWYKIHVDLTCLTQNIIQWRGQQWRVLCTSQTVRALITGYPYWHFYWGFSFPSGRSRYTRGSQTVRADPGGGAVGLLGARVICVRDTLILNKYGRKTKYQYIGRHFAWLSLTTVLAPSISGIFCRRVSLERYIIQ